MDAETLWDWFTETEHFTLKPGAALEGFMPDRIGGFYAYYQWYCNKSSAEVVKRIPVEFLLKAYHGLHDLDLGLAVKKVGDIDCTSTAELHMLRYSTDRRLAARRPLQKKICVFTAHLL